MNQNFIHEEFKIRLKSGSAGYHSVQNLLFSSLQSKKFKDNDIQNCNLACSFLWLETCPLTLREECRWGMLENRVLRRILGPKRNKITGEYGKLHNQ